jgi:dTDP-4-amino-4,6-dideoxygalactose transaminase
VEHAQQGVSQRGLYDHLRGQGILANLHYIPVYRQPFYQRLGFKLGYCPNAEDYFSRTISIPMFATLPEEKQIRIIEEIKRCFAG